MKLLIISHTAHYREQSGVYGWGPTVREIDCLAQLFDTVIHLAPLHRESIPGNALSYQAKNIEFRFVSPSGGAGLKNKLNILVSWGSYLRAIIHELKVVDAVHVRCPANISLLALIVLIFQKSSKYRWVKYAGNWRPEGTEPWSYRLQRWILERNLHHGVVTVNGSWPDQPRHAYSFNNPSLTQAEIAIAGELAQEKELSYPLQLLFAGRIEAAKGVERIIQIAKLLLQDQLDFQIDLIGDGPQKNAYEAFVQQFGLGEKIRFLGWKPRQQMDYFYAKAHFFLLPSASEGWPKVLSEAMAYGVVPLASTVSAIPQILDQTGAGLAIPAEDTQAYVKAIKDLSQQPGLWKQYSQAGMRSAQLFSYRHYLGSVTQMFQRAWGINLAQDSQDEGC